MSGTYREMLDFIHRENLARFHERLAKAPDELSRQALHKIIANEITAHNLRVQWGSQLEKQARSDSAP